MADTRSGPGGDLLDLIRAEIEAAPMGRITFARFMERALTEPELGYYAKSQARPTREGDFLTAPELHPLFGRLVGRQLEEMWARMDRPDRFTVREYGAGRGMLAATIRAGLVTERSGLADALVHEAVDLGAVPTTPSVVGCVLANEFLDALPVHRVTMQKGELHEIHVTWGDGRLADELAVPSTPALAEHLARDGVVLADGQLAEIGLAAVAWLRNVAREVERGYVLVIDYGHPAQDLYGPRRSAGTLMGYREHRIVDDLFDAVGDTDLTAHVDLTALRLAAREAGLEAAGSTTQAAFVTTLGIGDLLRDLGSDPAVDPQAYLAGRSAVARLLDPRHLGAFRVLAWAKGAPTEPPLRGFQGGGIGR